MEDDFDKQRAAMLGRDVAQTHMFKFMRTAIHRYASPEAHHAGLPYRQLLRQSLTAFRGEHLSISPSLPIPPELHAVAQAAYREKLDALCASLLDGLPDG